MSNPSSVLDKARAMTAEASRLQQGAEAEHEADRISQRVDDVTKALLQLGQVAAAADRLHAAGGSKSVDLSRLDDGLATFARHAASGLPSNQVFTAARQKINGVTARVSEQLEQAWSQWTAKRMADLPLVRIPLLDGDGQTSARERRDELQKLLRKPVPTSTDISLFQSAAELLQETLSQVANPPEEILALLQRLGERPPLTLDQLTDQQISLLRQADIAGQIEVRRRGM